MVLITPDELAALIKSAVAEALAGHKDEQLPVDRVAELLGCGVRQVWRLAKRGQLQVKRIGRRSFALRSEVDRYLASL